MFKQGFTRIGQIILKQQADLYVYSLRVSLATALSQICSFATEFEMSSIKICFQIRSSYRSGCSADCFAAFPSISSTSTGPIVLRSFASFDASPTTTIAGWSLRMYFRAAF